MPVAAMRSRSPSTHVLLWRSKARSVVPNPPEPKTSFSRIWNRRKMPLSLPHSLEPTFPIAALRRALPRQGAALASQQQN